MVRLSRIGQDKIAATLALLLVCWGAGQPAFGSGFPPFAFSQSVTTAEDAPSPITLAANDPESDPLTFNVLAAPANGILSGAPPNLTYTPNANFNGSDSFTFNANDGSSNSAPATVSITVTAVNDAPVATAQAVTATEDTPQPITLAATDVEGDPLTFTAGAPTNGTLSGTAPNLTYTPNANFNGADSFTFTANDGQVDSAPATVSITVTAVNDAPVATAQAVTATEDTPQPITLAATDVEGDPLTFTAGAPTNGTLSGTAPNLTYTPNANFNGADSFTFTANDGQVDSAPATVSITVTAVNDAPVATAQAVTATEDTPQPITLAATDVEGDPLTFTAGAPTNGTLSGTAPNLTYTPNANFNGADSFTFTANDGQVDSAPATVSITVTAVNDAPVATAQAVTATEDTPQPITLAATDVEGDPLTFTAGAPTNGTLSGTAPNLTYTPNANFNGADSFTFTANDGQVDSAPATVSITVTAVNDAPVATAQAVTATEDTPQPITLAATDVEGDPLTFTAGAPANGTLSGTAPNLTYTPNLNFNGSDSFTFTANDGTVDSAPATVSITVSSVNDPPVATAQAVTATEDTPQPITLAATDVEGDPLTFTAGAPANGTLSGTAPNLTYTPNANYNGPDSFTFTANDGQADSAPATVSISVTQVNDPPTVTAPVADMSPNEDSPPIVIPLGAHFGDADIATNGDVLTYTVTSNDDPTVVNSSITGSDLTLTFPPNANGVANITVQARDTAGATVSDSFVVTVNPVDDIPVAVDDSATMNEDGGSVDIDVLANDSHGDDPTTVISAGTTQVIGTTSYPDSSETTPTTVLDETGTDVTLPNGSLVINGNIITYTPKDNYNGTDHFSYTIQDADGETSTATVTVTINAVNDPPRLSGNVTYTIAQGSVLDIVASGGLADQAYDPDGDPISVIDDTQPASLGMGFAPTLTSAPDGSFTYTPDVTFVGQDSFVIRYDDGTATSTPVTVTINVVAAAPPPTPPPPGDVNAYFPLANVPLEDAVSAEANVLVVMDDSGSMDWGMMTDDTEGEFWLTNAGIKDRHTGSYTYDYRYLLPLTTNVYGNGNIMPTEEGLAADGSGAFGTPSVGNPEYEVYGVWRARNSQYNTVYYNPQIQYKPWVGLNRNNVDFPNAPPTAAPLDPYDVPIQTIDLTKPITFTSNRVPQLHNSGSYRNVTNKNIYLPQYYTTTATGRPAWNDSHTQIEILNNGTTYAGGPARGDCAVGDGDPMTCTYAQEIQNFANWFTYYRSREYTAKAALGRTIADVTDIRVGYVVLNNSNERIPVASMNNSYQVGNKKALLNQIYEISSNNGTPLRKALDKAGRYFSCKSGDSFGSKYNSSPGDAACPILASPEGECQNNFTLLFSDGTWNGSYSGGNNDGDDNTAFDGGKFADTVSGTLADVAMYYYEHDLQPTLINGVPTTARDIAGAPSSAFGNSGETTFQHMTTYTIGFGLQGLIDPATVQALPYATPFAWGNPFNDTAAKIDDMLHAAVNGRGQALSANNPVLLSSALQSAFQDFSNGSVSVSAVAFNSTALREQTVEYRGFFNLKYNTGDLRALNVDASTGVVDEANPIWRAAPILDSVSPANRVIVTYDRVNGTGVPFRYGNLNANQRIVMNANEVNYIRGDRSLEEPNGSFRARPAVEGLLGDIVHSAPQFVGAPRAIRRDQSPYPTTDLYSAFKDASAAREPLVYIEANDGMLHGFNAVNGTERMDYVPNKLIDGSQKFQNVLDQLTLLTYQHRFFVDITPSVEDVYMPPHIGSIAKQWSTVLVGGLGGGGKGYFALNVSNPTVDYTSEAAASNAVLWEFTDADDTYPVDSNGVPLGGAVGAKVDKYGLPIKDLGYTYSAAQIVMTNANDSATPPNKKWAAVFGNGYNSTAGIAKLFVLPLEGGLDGWQPGDFTKIDTGEGVKSAPDVQAGLPNGLGTPAIIDVDLNGTADIAYAGDLFGNLYRFDISNSDPTKWKATKLFQATYTRGGVTTRQPITTQPYVIKNPTQAGFIVIFGTGSYVTENDGVSTEIQSVYGIWDRGEIAPPTANSNAKATRLVQQVVTNVVDETNAAFQNLRIVSANPVAYTPDNGATPGVYGWYFDLDLQRPSVTLQGNPNPDTTGAAPPAAQFPGERAIRRFVPRGNELLITTVVPRDANTCLRSPPGSTFPIDALTGGNPKRAILDLNNDGVIDGQDFVTIGGVQYAAGILFSTDDLNGQLVDPSLLLGTGAADFLFLSGGDQQLTIRVAGPEDSKTGRLSWRELDDAN